MRSRRGVGPPKSRSRKEYWPNRAISFGRARDSAGTAIARIGIVRRNAMNIHSMIGLAVFAGLILPTPAHAVDRFGVVCVKNKTDVTITYRVQEGNGEWRVKTLQPGWEQAFVHRYSRPNENRSPELDIQFDSDLRAQRQFAVKYKLPRRAATGDSCGEGAQYQFEYDRGNRTFIDLKRAS